MALAQVSPAPVLLGLPASTYNVFGQPIAGFSYAPMSIIFNRTFPSISIAGVVPVPASLAGLKQLIMRRPSSDVRYMPSGPAGLAASVNKGSPAMMSDAV